jgi:hypothetical protein
MAILTADGIQFSVGNVLNSRYGIIPQTNSPMLFLQATAPVGWTRIAQNDRALRVVTASGAGTGGSAGGTNTFSSTFGTKTYSANVPVTISSFSMGATTISVNTMAIHSHALNSGGNSARNGPNPSQGTSNGTAPGNTTGNNGGGGSHTHPAGYTSANGPGSASVNMAIQYVDCNICRFD